MAVRANEPGTGAVQDVEAAACGIDREPLSDADVQGGRVPALGSGRNEDAVRARGHDDQLLHPLVEKEEPPGVPVESDVDRIGDGPWKREESDRFPGGIDKREPGRGFAGVEEDESPGRRGVG